MRGISMSSRITSGTCSCSSAIASTPSFAVSTRMPLRSSRRCVTRRTVIESSTTSANDAVDRASRGRHRRRARAPLGAHQRAHVEDDHDAAVAQDGRAGDAADAGDLRTDRLDHDLAAADQLVGDQRGRVLAGADQDDRQRRLGLRQQRRAAADEHAEVLEAVVVAAVVEASAGPLPGAAGSRRAVRRATPSTVGSGSANSSSCDAHDQRLA